MVTIAGNSNSGRRVSRRPKHSWNIRHRPWQIQPCMIAPVLAGETLTNLQWQARVVTDPIKNPLIGWWYETLFFYVKLQQLEYGSIPEGAFTNMLIDPTYSMSGYYVAANTKHYHHAGTIDYVNHCLNVVVDHYFRDEGESALSFAPGFAIDGVQIASVGTEGSWAQSLTAAATLGTVDIDVDNIDGVPTDAMMASDIEKAMFQWALNKQQGLSKLTFEEYLATFGMGPGPQGNPQKPELLRFNRAWSYPSNTVDPLTGIPTSAVSWSISERADKRRMFTQPGFIFGVSICRPKVYRGAQNGSMAHSMNNALRWMPALLAHDANASVITIDHTVGGPLTGQTGPYTVDLKDLLLYGDQFLNYPSPDTVGNQVTLPNPDGTSRYADAADADAMFKGASPANQIRADGVCQMNILGTQTESTP